ncbi:MAG: protein BatD [Bacteroidetes bacterium]|nr:MAG: protein BatD [Bacteroidota bacterium]MBL1145292.1 protein BatD [Bacteroidota bacterium]NOG58089.1 protein BatD [Bacteroidota bacterium]
MKKLILFIGFIGIVTSIFASSISFTAKSSHQKVEVGQRFQITYTINSNGGSFTPPSFEGFNSYSAGQSTSMQNINGKVTRTNSISYVLVGTQEGKFEIPPAEIEIDGETYTSNSIEIEVVAANSNSANAQRNRQNNRKSGGEQIEDYIYLEGMVDKKSAYIGEKVTVTFKMYTQLPVSRVNPEKLPDLKGFWSENITDYSSMKLSNTNINGVAYQVADVQQIVLFPQRAGELVIDPLEINAIVQIRSRNVRSIWDQMMGGGIENKEVILTSKPIKLSIKALPNKGKPDDFSGAVGQFNMKFNASKTEVKSNEAIDINILISGSGNLPLIGAPKLSFPSDFETYDPETKNNFTINASGSSGSKSFKYLVIPRHSGNFDLDPYSFSYFDPNTGSYKTISQESIQIKVAKSAEEVDNVVLKPREKEAIALLNTDIRYIHINNVSFITAQEMLYGSSLYYFLLFGAVLLFILLFIFSRKRKERNADTVGIKKSKANKLAKKRMAKAKKYLDANNLPEFYEEISAAIYGYYSDKFNINMAELSQDRIMELIGNASINENLKMVLDEAEMARFATSTNMNAADLYQNAIAVISKTEDYIK